MEKITNRIMLCALTVTKPKMSEKDKVVTREVAADKNASTSSVAVVKRLYPKALIDPITEVENAARRHIDSLSTMSLGRMGMIPMKLLPQLLQDIGVFRVQFQQSVTVFLNNFANVMYQAQAEQGSMFDSSSYPDLSTLKAQFSFEMTYVPMGEVPNVIDGLEADLVAELKESVEQSTRASIIAGQKESYARLSQALTRISLQCGNPKGRIYETLTGNLDELLKVLPHLNLSNDQAFNDLCEEARSLVIHPEAIKADDGIRESMAVKADAMLAKMASMGF